MPKRKRYYKRKSTTAKRALSLAKKNSRKLASEVKRFDHGQSAIDINNTTGSAYPLTDILQGDGDQQREGLQIRLKALDLKYIVSIQAAPTARIRLAIVRYNEGDTVNPTCFGTASTDVYQNVNYPVISPRKWVNRRQTTTLWTRTFIGNDDAVENWTGKVHLNIDSKLFFRDNTADSEQGGIFLLAMSDQAAGANAPHLTFFSRIKYYDN